MPTSAAPRHAHDDRDNQTGPSHTGPALGGAAGVLILVTLLTILIGEWCGFYDFPAVAAMFMTAGGVGGLIISAQSWMAIDAFWHTGEMERKVERRHEETVAELAALRQEVADLREFVADQIGEALAQAKFIGIAQGYKDGQGTGSLATAVPITSRRAPQPQ